MKLQQFLFGSSLSQNKSANVGWLLFRIHIGLSMAIHAGFPKIQNGTAPSWFIEQVSGLGFTFISPNFWATLSSWGEFMGGIFIAVGFLTRFSALQLAFQFFVISFLWYEKPEPITGMYFQQLYMWCYVLVIFLGSGNYSIDYLIRNKKVKSIEIITVPKIATILLLSLLMIKGYAQKPLIGSGVVINKTFDFKNFEKITCKDLDGDIIIETGKPFAIDISIDDNLVDMLNVKEDNKELEIKLDQNKNNKLYIENTNIKIRIQLPNLFFLTHSGNSNMVVNNLKCENFKLACYGNGSVRLNGVLENFTIHKSGNGTIFSKELIAEKAEIKKSGNGNVELNCKNNFNITSSGNGNTINYGSGKGIVNNYFTGNGKLIYK